MIKVIIFFIVVSFTNLNAEQYVEIKFNNDKFGKNISIEEARTLLSKLDNRKIPYKVFKNEYDNFLIEVSESSYVTGIEFGTMFREAVDASYDSGYQSGSWARKIYDRVMKE